MHPARRTPFVLAFAMSCAGLIVLAPASAQPAPARPDTAPITPNTPITPITKDALADLDVVGATRLVRGATATFEVRPFLARDWDHRDPLDTPITARLQFRSQTTPPPTPHPLTTTRDGHALTVTIPRDLPLGRAILQLEAPTPAGPATAAFEVEVVDTARLLLRVDSALVAPGGRLAWRALLIDTFTRRPLPESTLTATLLDAGQTPRVALTTQTDPFGLASGHLQIPASLRPGRYTLQVKDSATRLVATQSIELRPFEPQPFFVTISENTEPDRRLARFEIAARHADGSPMSKAWVVAKDPSGHGIAAGHTDLDGRFRFESISTGFTATVDDPRGESITASHTRADPVPLELELITGGSTPIAGEHFTVQIMTRQAGRPTTAPITLELRSGNDTLSTQTLTTGPNGLATATVFLAPRPAVRRQHTTSVTLTPRVPELAKSLAEIPTRYCLERGALSLSLSPAPNAASRWAIHAYYHPFPGRPDFAVALSKEQVACLDLPHHIPPRTPEDPNSVRADISTFETIALSDGELEFALVATSGSASTRDTFTTTTSTAAPLTLTPAVLAPGETLQVRAPPNQANRESIALLIDEGVAVAFATLVEGHASLRVPETSTGLLGVEVVSLDRAHGTRTNPLLGNVFVRPRPLTVTLDHPHTARPGATLPLTVTVTDRDRPVTARLFASVIDERLLALSPEVANTPTPASWLARESTPKSLHRQAPRFAELLLLPTPSRSEHALLQALLSTIPTSRPTAALVLPAAVRRETSRSHLGGLRYELVALAVTRPDLSLADDLPPLESLLTHPTLRRRSADRPSHLDPWHRPYTWASARLLASHFDAKTFGREVTTLRLDKVIDRLRHKATTTATELSKLIKAPRHLTLDAWGRPLLVTPKGRDLILSSAGPDGTHGTDDDLTLSRDETLQSRLLDHGSGGFGYVGDGAGGGGSAVHSLAALRTANAEVLAAVRERFDTNVLWASATTNTAGQHRFEVPLSDSTTTWRIDVEAMTDDGRFGHARSQLGTSLPVSVDLRLPDSLIVGDRFVARALAVNTTTTPRDLTLTATAEGLTLGPLDSQDKDTAHVRLGPGESKPLAIPLFATQPGRARVQLTLTDSDGLVVDSMAKNLDVQDIGQERRLTRRVRLDGRSPVTLDTAIPDASSPPRELTATLTAHRGAPDLALSSLAALLKTPTGCFEQTTARSWPNLLVLRLLPKDSEFAGQARDLAVAGYERLKTFEVRGRGFALYPGESPATILTAIGLVQLVDAATVIDVERPLLDRIATALIARQSTDGRFRVDTGWYGSEDPLAVTAYAAWSLAEALRAHTTHPEARLFSEPTIRALNRALASARRALSRRAADPMNPRSAYIEVLSNLAGVPTPSSTAPHAPQQPFVTPSTIYSSGPSAQVELAALSLLDTTRRAPSSPAVSRYLDGLMAARASGGWPTTQATIHALRALAELGTGTPTGHLDIDLGGQALDPIPLDSTALPIRTLQPDDLARLASLDGPNGQLTLRSTSPVMVELDLTWRETAAPNRTSHGLTVHVEAPAHPVRIGGQTTLTLGVHNPGEAPIHLPTAVLELPPGFTLDVPSLRQLARAGGRLDHVEVFGRRVELYFDALPGGGAALVPLTLTATHEAEVTMRPAEAFAYYDPELRGLSDPLRLTAF